MIHELLAPARLQHRAESVHQISSRQVEITPQKRKGKTGARRGEGVNLPFGRGRGVCNRGKAFAALLGRSRIPPKGALPARLAANPTLGAPVETSEIGGRPDMKAGTGAFRSTGGPAALALRRQAGLSFEIISTEEEDLITGQIIVRHQGDAPSRPAYSLQERVLKTRQEAGQPRRKLLLLVGIIAVPEDVAERFGSVRGLQYQVTEDRMSSLYSMMGDPLPPARASELTLTIHPEAKELPPGIDTPSGMITSPIWQV